MGNIVRPALSADWIQAPGRDGWRKTDQGTTQTKVDLSAYVGRYVHVLADGAYHWGMVAATGDTLKITSTTGIESDAATKRAANVEDKCVIEAGRPFIAIAAVTGTVDAEFHIR